MHGQELKVLVVDDAPDVTSMIAALLSAEPDIRVVGTLNSAADLVQSVASLAPTVVLLDLTMPGVDPLAALRQLKASSAGRGVRVIAYSGHDGPDTVAAAREAGACSLVSKATEPGALASAIRQAAAG
jgi:DNA-binding NarL/FixJ family response regulator